MSTVSFPPATPDDSQPIPGLSLADFVDRVEGLYTLPGVAVQLVALTERDDVDAFELQQCIQNDPAIAARVLRVVNSSLFGLSGQVTTLGQAIALLGIRPLKLMGLAFCLPEQLFMAVAGDQLELFWQQSILRAVAARDISEKYFRKAGDEAFLAGLLHDIGILVMLGQLGEPYAAFYQQTIDDQIDLATAESEQFGFNHRQLAAELLTRWKMPTAAVDAIAGERVIEVLAPRDDPESQLTQTVHLADMFSQVVVLHRLSVLPELSEAGTRYCGMSRSALHDLVVTLEEDVRQLAAVLGTKSHDEQAYRDLLANAQQQMARLLDQGAAALVQLGETRGGASSELVKAAGRVREALDIARPMPAVRELPLPCPKGGKAGDYLRELTLAVGGCRAVRQPLSVAYLAVEAEAPFCPAATEAVEQVLRVVCRRIDVEAAEVYPIDATRRLIVLPGCERHEAVAVVAAVLAHSRTLLSSLRHKGKLPESIPSAGVASVVLPPKNFSPQALYDAALRCQAATRPVGGVKSLEVC